LPNDADKFGASIGNAQYKGEKNHDLIAAFRLFVRTLPIPFGFTGAETEIHKIKDDSEIKMENNLNRRGPRHIPNV
jgi:hypothetical protein